MARSRRRGSDRSRSPSSAPAPDRSVSWRRRGAWLALALGGASIAAAASLHARRPPAASLRRPGLDVLLVTIDTLRADAVGAYGATTGATPLLDAVAARGVVFRQAHAHNV